jgi:hypothetical protein
VLPASIVQFTSVPLGKLSLTLSPVAVPAPPLFNVTVKPICDPELTLAASAVLLMLTAAQRTLSEAEEEPPPSLPVVKLAVL